MKNYILLLATLLSTAVFAQQDLNDSIEVDQNNKAEQIANSIANFLVEKNYDTLSYYFDDNLNSKLNAQKISFTFGQLETNYGKLKQGLDFELIEKGNNTFYAKGLEFEKEKLNLQFQLNEENKLNSFMLNAYTYKNEWKAPPYTALDKVEVKKISIGDALPLQGELTLPKGVKNPPIVILVHGSGPNNMDEQVGPNRIFKDLAYGMSSSGIGCLRYNKRSYEYPSEMAKNMDKITIDYIVVDDAVAAIEKAKSLTKGPIIIAGHSLGGYMAPKIADKTEVDGVIIMAGNVSPLGELIVPQYQYLKDNDTSQNITEFQMNMVRSQVKNLQEGNYDSTTVGPLLPLGLPGSFWLSLKDYYLDSIAQEQKQPYLILNGGRDYQVTTIEAKKWNNGNSNKASKTIIYPEMNHLFFKGEGICLPIEYYKEECLDIQVLIDIISWIESL